MSNDSWDEFFIKLTRLIAEKSKDQSTKCGCVIVGPDNEVRSMGYNGLPRGMEYVEEVHQRPYKYMVFEHAERNAIYNAVRMGLSLKDCTAYVTGPPCCDCARGLIQSGITRVVIPEHHNFVDRKDDTWTTSCSVAEYMFRQTNVKFEIIEGI